MRKSYYKSFLILIAVPILLIIIAVFIFVQRMMTQSAISQVQLAQENIAEEGFRGNEIRDAKMRLSHFCYVNDGEILEQAALTDTADVNEKYANMKALQQSFNYVMVPITDILSAGFYMESGRTCFLKDNLVLEDSQVQAALVSGGFGG